MSRAFTVLPLLADGRFHSGPELARRLRMSRSAVWSAVHALTEMGLDVDAVRGKGYRLPRPVELLRADALQAELGADVRAVLGGLEVLPEVDSTNRYLLERIPVLGRAHACCAEYQRAGRGRRGRRWVSPPASNVYLSLLWRFEDTPQALAGLSIAVAVQLVRALRELGVGGVQAKWPNDLVWHDRKLGGVLIDLSGESHGPAAAVIGVGINYAMPWRSGQSIDQPWCDVQSITGAPGPGRNRLAGRVLHHLLAGLMQFERQGLAPFRAAWAEFDAVAGREVRVHLPQGDVDGTAAGIEDDGALVVTVGGRRRAFRSGEVSIRVRP